MNSSPPLAPIQRSGALAIGLDAPAVTEIVAWAVTLVASSFLPGSRYAQLPRDLGLLAQPPMLRAKMCIAGDPCAAVRLTLGRVIERTVLPGASGIPT